MAVREREEEFFPLWAWCEAPCFVVTLRGLLETIELHDFIEVLLSDGGVMGEVGSNFGPKSDRLNELATVGRGAREYSWY